MATQELGEEDKARVRRRYALDAYRLSLAAPESWKAKVWKFLNSAVVLWFLSAVVVAAITSFIAERERHERENLEATLRTHKVLYELGHRWKFLYYFLGTRSIEDHLKADASPLRELMFGVPDRSALGAGLPEFRGHSISGLLIELQVYASDAQVVTRIRRARTSLHRVLSRGELIFGKSADADATMKVVRQFEKDLLELLKLAGYRGDAQTFDEQGEVLPSDFPRPKRLPKPSMESGADAPRSK